MGESLARLYAAGRSYNRSAFHFGCSLIGSPVAGEVTMSWKVEVITEDSGEWESDPARFDTKLEALAYARDLELRCATIRDKRVTESDDPVSSRWIDHTLRAVKSVR
jgi:hypothetical protein